MLVVAGARRDPVARKVAARWGAALLTERDLSRPGWCHRPGAPRDGAAVVEGQVLPTGAIDGLLNRLPGVQAGDLTHIVPADREYVAQEMNAFLLSWLAALPCPVLNRPDPGHDGSLHWLPVQWVRLATRLGVPVLPVSWRIAPDGSQSDPSPPPASGEPAAHAGWQDAPVCVTVIGRRCLGAPGPRADPPAAAAALSSRAQRGIGESARGPGADSRMLRCAQHDRFGPLALGGLPDASRSSPRAQRGAQHDSGAAPGGPPDASRRLPRAQRGAQHDSGAAVDPVLAGYARRLSRASGLPLLGLTFSGPGPESRLLAADPWPDVSAPPLAEAVRAYLRRRARRDGE